MRHLVLAVLTTTPLMTRCLSGAMPARPVLPTPLPFLAVTLLPRIQTLRHARGKEAVVHPRRQGVGAEIGLARLRRGALLDADSSTGDGLAEEYSRHVPRNSKEMSQRR